MTGTRLPDETDWSSDLPAGSYWKMGGHWYCITPNGEFGGLYKHAVTEHEDHTITVSPSILIHPGKGYDVSTGQAVDRAGWHGFLERGVWRSC